ncbi:MAG: M23 family metallopeptidase [Bacteroidales bacterium]|nr:M23 family metallopeptidase [Bacteroidales bacterium]
MKKFLWIISTVTALALVAAAVYWYLLPDLKSITQQEPAIKQAASGESVARIYGLAVDSFTIETDKVGRDQNLGQILNRYSLPERALTQLLLYADNVFDVRKIRQGNNYTAFLSKDSLSRLQYFVYEHSPIEYVVFDFTDSVKIYLREKEVVTRQKRVNGEIITSLWDAVTRNNINPQVALELSEMYAWTVDFFGLQPGDHFAVVYDELYVDTISIGLGRIHAASFHHVGKELLAIPFMQDSVETYFDADGNSLRRAFLKAPLKFNRISSRFSGSRLHPILKIRRPHYGVDYAAPIGTPVHAIGDGRVMLAGYQSGAGRIVKVRHNAVYTSTYMHLSGFGKGIATGTYVKQGELLGYVGSSGLSTGPHLDFRVTMNGSPIDPLKMVSPPVDPIKPENRMAFNSVKMATIDLLTSKEENEMAEEFIPTGLPKDF